MRPLLIGQGANDPRVKQAESDQIVQAMTQRGIPVTYLRYPDEGHGFAGPRTTSPSWPWRRRSWRAASVGSTNRWEMISRARRSKSWPAQNRSPD